MIQKMPYWINDNRVELKRKNAVCKFGKHKIVNIITKEKGAIIEDIFWVITSDPKNKGLALCEKMPKQISTNMWDFRFWKLTFFNSSRFDITFDVYVQILHQAGMVEVEIR